MTLSAHRIERAPLDQFDVLIKSPGISPYRTGLQRARSAGVLLTSGSQLWFAQPRNARVIAVTGSKGKSTTASLIHFLLRAADQNTVLAGNIGVPLLQLLDPLGEPDFFVVELSSYQTYDFDGRPDVAVLTNLFPEHLDWHGDVARYYADKLKLFAKQPAVALINGADQTSFGLTTNLSRTLFNDLAGWHLSADELMRGDELIVPLPAWRLPGQHNLSNLVCALAAVDAAGIDVKPGLARLGEFEGLPHRLQLLGRVDGIDVVDDSIATAPNAVVAALQAFPGRATTVIVGGQDRGVDWQLFADHLKRNPAHLIIARGENGPAIAALIRQQLPDQAVCELAGMHDAVRIGLEMTPPEGVLLLSPGAPSYGEYQDFQDRGKAFASAAGLTHHENT